MAQKATISEAEVTRIVKTLSTDEMQGRKVFTPGITKASAFIEQEFKKIGLQPFPGLQSYSQSFSVYSVEPIKQEVSLNEVVIPNQQILISSSQEAVNWTSQGAPAPEQAIISASENFVARASSLLDQKKNLIVLVNPAHAEIFQRYKTYLGRRNMRLEKAENTVVFVLADLTQATKFSVNAQNKVVEQKLNNVVGMLPGKSRKEEYVIFSGHYDHIGIQPAVNGDSIANGADDDASGITAVIALAKHFKQKKNNERSLLFVAFTAEEVGGYGSQYFSKQLNPDQVVAMFNIEMIGKESQFGKNAGFITGFDRSDFGQIVQRSLSGYNFQFHPDPYVKENLFYRSDNATLARLGVPAHSLSTDKIDTDKLYHSVDDEFESLDISNLTQTIRAIAKGAESIIAGKDTPTRIAPEPQH